MNSIKNYEQALNELVYSFVKKWYLENYDENRDGGFDYDLI
jgi:hypothetical protein